MTEIKKSSRALPPIRVEELDRNRRRFEAEGSAVVNSDSAGGSLTPESIRQSPRSSSRFLSSKRTVGADPEHTLRPGLRRNSRSLHSLSLTSDATPSGLYNKSMDLSIRKSMPDFRAVVASSQPELPPQRPIPPLLTPAPPSGQFQIDAILSPRIKLVTSSSSLSKLGSPRMLRSPSINWESSPIPLRATAKQAPVPPLLLEEVRRRNPNLDPPYASSRQANSCPGGFEWQPNAAGLPKSKFRMAISSLSLDSPVSDTGRDERLRSERFRNWAQAEGLDQQGRHIRPRWRSNELILPQQPSLSRQQSLEFNDGMRATENTADAADPKAAEKEKLVLQNIDLPREPQTSEAQVGSRAGSRMDNCYDSSDDESVDPSLYDKIIFNIDNASRKDDVKARMKEKAKHSAEVRRRGVEIEAEKHERRVFVAERSRRIAMNAANQRNYAEQCTRLKKMAPLLFVVSKMGHLAERVRQRRALVQFEEKKLLSTILIQRIFRGYQKRKEYKRVYWAAAKISAIFRSTFCLRIEVLKRTRAAKIIRYLRDVKETGEFSTLMKIAVHEIVRERRRASMMKTLSGALTRTVLMGQWASAERRQLSMYTVDNHKRENVCAESYSDEAVSANECAAQLSDNGNSSPARNGASETLREIPTLVKILVMEAFIDFRSQQYIRVMGRHWHRKALYRRLKRERHASQLRGVHLTSRTQSARERQTEPVLLPRPRGCRQAELKAMMQQGAYEFALMEEEGIWDLSSQRDFVPSGEDQPSHFSKDEQARIIEIQDRLKLRLFMSNISVKAGLMAKFRITE